MRKAASRACPVHTGQHDEVSQPWGQLDHYSGLSYKKNIPKKNWTKCFKTVTLCLVFKL
jgi:hypothetical protein